MIANQNSSLPAGWYVYRTTKGFVGIVLHHGTGPINLGAGGVYGGVTNTVRLAPGSFTFPVTGQRGSIDLPQLLSRAGGKINSALQRVGANPKQITAFMTQADTAAGKQQSGGGQTTEIAISQSGQPTASSGRQPVSTKPSGDINAGGIGISGAISGIGDFLSWIAWMFNPLNWLRLAQFIVGMLLMFFGMYLLFQRRPLSSSGAGIGRVSRQLAAFTPPGRALNVSRGRRMGRREGQVEAGRLEGRRMGRAEAETTQRRGQARSQRNRGN